MRFHFFAKIVCGAPLTTPEEAQAFLNLMRDKSHQRFEYHQPPTHLSADGMDAWYYKQKQREKELRERRREAEEILRRYRGGRESIGRFSIDGRDAFSQASRGTPRESFGPLITPREGHAISMATPMSTISQLSEALDDPHNFKSAVANLNIRLDPDSEAQAQQQAGIDDKWMEDEKKLDDQQNAQTLVREITSWRYFVSQRPDAKFPPEAGRYHL